MAGKKQVIRRVQHSTVADFDEQLWPINCALLVLAGFVAGIIVATSQFDGVPWFKNGWFRLGVLGLTLVVLFAGSFWLHRKRSVRRIQLAVLLSLLVNMGVEFALYRTYLDFAALREEQPSEWIDEQELVTLPDYGRQPTDQVVPEELERPVETVTPEAPQPEVARQEVERPPSPDEKPTTEPTEQNRQATPVNIERAQASTTAPRRSETPASQQASRQTSKTPELPTDAIPTPAASAAAQATANPLQAQVAPMQRQQSTDPQLQQRPPAPDVTATASAPSATATQAQRTAAEQQPNVATTAAATPTRQTTRPTTQPNTVETPQPTATAQAAQQAALNPAATSVTRQATAAPATQQNQTAPAAAATAQTTPAEVARRQTTTEASPTTPQPQSTAVARQTAGAAVPAAAEAPTPAAVATAQTPAAAQPAATQVTRQQSGALPSNTPTPAATPAEAATPSTVAAAAPRRAESTERPQPNATAVASAPTRSTTPAAAAAAARAEQLAAAPAASSGAAAPLQASNNATVGRSTTAPAAVNNRAAAAAASETPSQQIAQVQPGRAAQRAEASVVPSPQPQAVGRTASSRSASIAATAEATMPAAAVAESGGQPTPSANAQATAAARANGPIPLPNLNNGPARPLPGEAANTAAGLAAAQPRRAETTVDRNLASQTPGAGQVAHSQGLASPSPSSTSVPLESPTPAAGSVASSPTTGPLAAMTGVAKATGSTPTAAQQAAATADAPAQGEGAAPAAASIARAATQRNAAAPAIGGGQTTPVERTAVAAVVPGIDTRATGDSSAPSAVATTNAGHIEAGATTVATRGEASAPVGTMAAAAAPAASGNPQATASPVAIAAAQRTGGDTVVTGPAATAGPTRATAQATVGQTTAEAAADAGPGIAASGAAAGSTTSPREANVGNPTRSTSGIPGDLLTRADTGSPAVGAAGTLSPSGVAASRRAETDDVGPVATGPAGGQPVRQGAMAVLPAGLAEADDPGPVAGSLTTATVAGGQGPAVDQVARQASGLLPVQIAAVDGPGGLSSQPSPDAGVPNRLARRESDSILPVASRFIRDRSTGVPSIDTKAFDDPSPAFNARKSEERPQQAKSRGGSSGSERAVEMGLDYLARQQLTDGRWSLQNVAVGGTAADQVSVGQMQADTAATGLSLLCFLGAGYTHTDGKYKDNVGAGVAWLVDHQKPDGDLFNAGSKYVWYYSHGIAAIALCEAYGMTGDRQLKGPAQKALDFIVSSQHPTQGGWRYAPQSGSDTSVSGWQMMALKSGELAGLKVPPESFVKVQHWLDSAQGPSGSPSRYSYRPESQIPHQRNPSLAMTAEGLLMRLYTGWARNDPNVIAGADYIKQNLPAVGTRAQPLRDSYYWYYATQVMFQVQGEHWNAWNERLRTLLISSQVQSGGLAGSWDPRGAVPDRWGLEGGRIYITAMHLLMLEVYYRHLPLYQTLEK